MKLCWFVATLALASAHAQEGVRQTHLNDYGLTPKAPIELVVAKPFKVEKPIPFVIDGKKKQMKKEGYLLVLKADKDLLAPKNSPDFLIYADKAVGWKINSGYRSGHVVVMVPKCDLLKANLWFGSRLVPNHLTPALFKGEVRDASSRKVKPFSKKAVTKALKTGGDTLVVKDMNELWFESKPLILRYSPDERELAESLVK